ncbi:uncharacterized protein [Typha angustifolia]|uniref:uncharacterized protein isoform X1 n=1 Tax=Typha angustifolia TaxID=59011 RepID=UPI003C2D9108
MGGTSPNVRFVRCPKCHLLLVEYSNVPVYPCGGCGTTLQAKKGNAGGSSNSVASEADNYSNPPDNFSTDTGSVSSKEDISPLSSNTNISELEEVNSLDLSRQPGMSPNLAHKFKEPSHTISRSIASVDDILDRASENGPDENLRSPATRSAYAYDGSSSFSDAGSSAGSHGRAISKSRRTFRAKASVRDDSRGYNKVSAAVEADHRASSHFSKSPNASFNSDTMEKYSTRRYESSSKYGINERLRGTSVDSEDSQSMQSSMDSQEDFPQNALFKSKQVERDYVERQRKMGAFRDSPSKFSNQRVPEESFQHRGINPQRQIYSHKSNQQSPPRPNPSPTSCIQGGLFWDNKQQKSSCNVKRQVIKHHCRPISEGAPFVICYKCFNLLQIPVGALVSRRRLNKLQCGSCSEVLMLSFPAKTSMDTEAHHTEARTGDDSPQDPVSIYEEYGMSTRSSSSETESVLHDNRNSSIMGGREQASALALHRLMGYASARDIMYQVSDIGQSFRSTASRSYQRSKESNVGYLMEKK